MIWIFDSWFGWLQTLKYFKEFLPQYDYIFFADSKNIPYWDKTKEQIKELTYKWLNFLFDKWAKIVILACNSASSYAIRPWQKDFPDKKTLSITIPWVESVCENWFCNVWLLATQITIQSWIYEKKTNEINPNNHINWYKIPATDLVLEIEKGNFETDILEKYFVWLENKLDALILWCTHFPIVKKQIIKILPNNIQIIDPAYESVKKFITYLEKHSDIKNSLSKWWTSQFYVSWDINIFKQIWEQILWESLDYAQSAFW